MQELEKIIEEINETIERYGKNPYITDDITDFCYGMNIAKDIIRGHMKNDGWIPVEERLPEKNEYFADTSSDREFPNGYYRRLEIAYKIGRAHV